MSGDEADDGGTGGKDGDRGFVGLEAIARIAGSMSAGVRCRLEETGEAAEQGLRQAVALMLLSILIPTIRSRAHFLARLSEVIEPQARDNPVIVLTDLDDGERPIGAKRQSLIDAAKTPYVAFVDDDDLVSADYARRICEVIRRDEPDIIGFRARKFVNGEPAALTAYTETTVTFPVEHRLRGLRKHRQHLNHLAPVRREIATAVGYRPWNLMEDGDYAKRLRTMFPELRETFVDAYLYDYLLRTDRTGEMTNARREAEQLCLNP